MATKGVARRSTRRGANRSENGERPATTPEYDRFERLTKRLLQVPKKEIDKAKKKAG